jgi:hypothetical protein
MLAEGGDAVGVDRSSRLPTKIMKEAFAAYGQNASRCGPRPKSVAALAAIALIWLWGVHAMAADGLITIKSAFGPEETMQRLEAEVRAKGMTVFAHVDHAAGAAAVGLPLRPKQSR